MSDDENIIETTGRIGAVLLAIMVTVAILAAVFGAGLGLDGESSFSPTAGENVTLSQGDTHEHTVSLTRGYAVGFDRPNAERYVDVPINASWRDGNWSVLLTARLGTGANANASYTAFAAGHEDFLLQYDNGEWVATVNQSGQYAQTTLAATDATDWTPLGLRWDAGTLTLANETTNTSSASSGTPINATPSADWRGAIEETRIVNGTISDADLDSYRSDPVVPLPDGESDQAARLMFDEGTGTQTKAFYAGGQAGIVGGGWVDGFGGPDVDAGTDYTVISTDPLRIQPIGGGLLDGVPIAYATFDGGAFAGIVNRAVAVGTSALALLVVAALITAASVVSRVLGRGWGDR